MTKIPRLVSALAVIGLICTSTGAGQSGRVQVGYCTSYKNAAAAKAAGFDYIEVGTSELVALSDTDFDVAAAQLHGVGLPVPTANLFLPGSLKVTGPDVNAEQQLAYVRTAFARLARLGTETVVFGSGGSRRVPDGFSRDTAFQQLVDFGKRIAPEARTHGIVVAIEPLRRQESNIINTASEGLALVEAVNDPNFQLMIDFFHLASEQESPEIVVKAGSRLRHLHMANPNGRVFPLVWSEFDYAPFFATLRTVGYGRRISVEATTANLSIDAPRAIDLLRHAFATPMTMAARVMAGMVPTLAAQAPSVGPRPNVGPANRPLVDPVAVARGQRVWAVECVTCHGASARGTDTAPSLIRSTLVLADRQGSLLGPFLKKGHPMQSGAPSASVPADAVADLTQFLRQRINDTLRGSPVFDVQNILVGNAAAGSTYFHGAGKCTSCHSPTGDLAGLATRVAAPVDIQQRMLFPSGRGRGFGRSAGPNRAEITVTVTPTSGVPVTGVFVAEDDFYVTLRDGTGVVRVIKRRPGMTVVRVDPLQAHHEWLDVVTDTNIHDLVAYLVTLK